ncbi:sensor histidine kinase [Phytohabitans houttuyneae]|uniref:histidine kinase n=1 Tax=Phytohabitans houttuyneae TaxID=1076126 RepID=A0A6V8K994_9ACTN|nr:HAMP domain-containing sensor histidine kinase [Phytohabitans houttuyneae]GFJ80060.1 hypothetical protein Phou_042400 [Phytohabitans houttuyneae]
MTIRGGWTVRVRLTALYGGLFLLAGAVLLGVTYLLLAASLEKQQVKPGIVYAEGVALPDDPPDAAKKDKAAVEKANIERKMEFAKQVQRDLNRQTLQSLVQWGSLALGGLAVAGVWMGWLAAGRTLRPIARITETARRVADRSLHERIALGGPRDELRELADTFDDMLERLDRAFDGQRRFVANASHELRTPLAINRTLLEVAMGQPDASPQLRQLGTTLLEVNARHERLIDGLLTMARSEQAVVDRVPVDLAEVAGNVLDQTRAPGVDVRHELLPAPTSGDPVLLERLAQNLVDNAVRYNATGGWVHVACTREGTSTRLSVINTGPVVRAYEVPGLFEPFRRLADRVGSARGTGLGLSIVRSVARAHGGEVYATPRDGGGLVVQVTLPAN